METRLLTGTDWPEAEPARNLVRAVAGVGGPHTESVGRFPRVECDVRQEQAQAKTEQAKGDARETKEEIKDVFKD
ncbi:hypothetical protein AB0M86_35290 [Streptomyces sp. NPDC051639]|uniref:hypothetical protein n=1 Tax=Streptomyces sp. NPDC051639 TaxID=3155671 RepID=UPI00342142B9